MSFQPNPGDELFINGAAYIVGQHPVAPGIVYAQAGRQGIVYQLIPVDGTIHEAKALKVFFPKFRIPAMVYQSDNMESFSTNPGLKVCHRDVLTPEKNGELIAAHPALLYAVFMPWIYGSTWFDIITEQRVLLRKESLILSKALAAIGSGMEQRGLSHCDLSAPNVMLPYFSDADLLEGSSPIELVDVEQMYSPKLDRPEVLLAGSAGYAAHRTVTSGLWSAYADRFAGAIIMSEMLGWCDPHIINAAWGESYFDQREMQNPCERYGLLKRSLEQNWGTNVAELFSRAWDSQDLSSCPTFGEWLVAISSVPEEIPVQNTAKIPMVDLEPESSELVVDESVVQKLFDQARLMENKGNLSGALEVYRSAYHFVHVDSPMKIELTAAIRELDEQLNPSSNDESVKGTFWRSRKFIMSIVAALILLAGAGLTVNYLLSVQNEEEHKKAQLESEKQTAEATRLEEATKVEEAMKVEEARKKEEAEEKTRAEKEKKVAEAKLSAAQLKEEEALKKEEERKELQTKYDKQAKYDAYLEQQKLAKQKLADQQEQEAQRTKELQAQQERDAEQRLATAKAEKEQAARAQELRKSRAQNVVKLIASYNQAYNAITAGNKSKAKEYALEFISRYEKDASYYKTVGKVSKRASSIYKLLSNQDYKLPDI
ncbi:hypothetical protein [Paenibacillus sp. DS2015]|uniref:hypothetical protein n=1 Tax=Paenibacillus sp. DS2015 TaxID=3373917 RepID=UPI003D245269